MQVVQRLVTLRDKISGLDDRTVVGHDTMSVPSNSLAARSFVDGAAAYSARSNPTDGKSSRDVVISPGFRLIVTALIGSCDIAAVALGCYIFALHFGFAASFLAGAPLTILAAHMAGLYKVDSAAHVRRTARSALAIGAVCLPVLVLLAWAVAATDLASRLAFSFASGMCLMVASRVGLAAMVDRLADRLAERVLIVGRSAATERLLDQQSQMPERPRVVGQILVGEGQPSVPLVGRLYPNAVSQTPVSYPIQGIDRIIILRDGLDDAQLGSITKQLEALHLPVHVLMDLPGVSGASGALDNVGWVLRERPMTPTAMIAKRALDLLVCCLALLFLAPLMLLVGLLVRLDSPGPALFRQTRLGRSNQPFTVYKFRTMRVDAHATDGSVQAVRGDVRVTRVGAFLRKTSIDELPQLLNVLNGTMSLVGPRPHPTELNKKFMPLIDSYAARHRIAPGITGWAQVNGFRGETRTVEQMQRRVELDLEYIRDRSVAFDLWILLRTVVSVFAHRNAAY